ncbi:MAG: Na(+)-translocating NADH-quinone reductase subunit A [bacterium]
MIKIKKGLDLPIHGQPRFEIHDAKKPSQVALLGEDYVGMKPTMMVKVGDEVKLGQLLFTDKKMPSVRYTSPGAGKVVAINRGLKRAFLSIVIRLEGSAELTFQSFPEGKLSALNRKKVVENLLESGLWTALRARPFSKVADPETQPHSIFITAMDTNPLGPPVEKVLDRRERSFKNGLAVLSRLTDGKLFLCKAPNSTVPTVELDALVVEEFAGPHPAGNPGTHIHFLDPVSRNKTVWHVGAQDVAAIGDLFTSGRLNMQRVISLAGPSVKSPRLLKTRIGAAVADLTTDELTGGENRIISGSVLSGRTAREETAYLGRFHQQISVVPENRQKQFLGWLSPGFNLYSVKNVVISKWLNKKSFHFTTSTNGGVRAIVPVGSYEKVMPLDILPTFLLRALAVDDVEEAEQLGCLELDEEDLALCTYVCPSKIDHGLSLRRNLTLIEKEG